KRAVELAQAETAQALENANVAFNAANRAYLQVETLTTSVTRNTTQIQVFASGMTAFQNRMTTAETSLMIQAGQISSKASQTTVDTLTGRVVTAENTILQNATTFLAKISETDNKIGVPFKINQWEKGSLSSSDGSEVASNAVLRSGFLDVTYGEKYISQLVDGSTVAFYYHYYGLNVPYVDFVPNGKQYTETLAAGAYTNETIASYLLVKNVENLPITLTPTTNPYSNSGDYLVIYKLPLDGKIVPQLLTWTGKKDSSDNTVWLYTNGNWIQIATIISSAQTTYEWSLTSDQQSGVTGDSLYLAFFSIKTSSYAGIYNVSTTPFNLNPSSDHLLYQMNTTNTSSAVTIPSGVVKMRVRVNTMDAPDVYQGNLYPLATRQDYTRTTSLYSAILMTKDLINLRVAKGDVINQINVSTEGILISGNKVHITGTTTIDSGVITSAMIATAAITNAKIGDATISSAKISSLDA
ncbi:phage tail spike protein, partial [Pseudolactococcus reticulitermitis]